MPGAFHLESRYVNGSFSQACHLVQNSSDLNITIKSLKKIVYIGANVIKLHLQFGPGKMISINHFTICQDKKQPVNAGITFPAIYHACVCFCLKVSHDIRNIESKIAFFNAG